MTKVNDGGPAFPGQNTGIDYNNGMNLRDWFAGQILAGLAGDIRKAVGTAASQIDAGPDNVFETKEKQKREVTQRETKAAIALAYALADMAIEQRNQ